MMFMITFKGVLWIIGITALVMIGLFCLLIWWLSRKSEDIEEWISVEDKMPSPNTTVLTAIRHRSGKYVYETNAIRKDGDWRYELLCDAKITHWRAFSELPKKLR